ncbi:hypothetical protein GE21DRAFT_6329 [Neurospora crassa]|uniref:Uncharacterized protein n=1 Tax=Neurospora crassa (strain ATCC 24698 / 74-OR23-1A / CBS 708.71 / DSM 1257 / FGSC 987) TaxID=367110 RepID=Q7S8Q4_NEUCR|nr:hypothetical protein NCU08649 [Neurospora crassa OR74A]EAA32714.1 hypothetical protein NCU08649 [Neurospora crassa OR74A]KHE82816.1 hypothetical protein GE21DRAFT_6329 [Neurospora crassa]|eukprot:XP_961950.1 hypothetical protein NCU08649 [Neurospora crassa OR74A]
MNLTHFLPWSLLLLVYSVLSAPSRTCHERSINHQDRCEDNALLQLLEPVDKPDTNRKLAESFCSSYFAGPAVVRPVQIPQATSRVTTMAPPPAVSPNPIVKPPKVRLGGHHVYEGDNDDSDDSEPDMTTITVTTTVTGTVTRTIIPTTTVANTLAKSMNDNDGTPATMTARASGALSRRRRVVARAPPVMEHCPQAWRGRPEDQIRRACACLVGQGKGTIVLSRAEGSTVVMTAPAPSPDVSSFAG